jgi:hypothetical protein
VNHSAIIQIRRIFLIMPPSFQAKDQRNMSKAKLSGSGEQQEPRLQGCECLNS